MSSKPNLLALAVALALGFSPLSQAQDEPPAAEDAPAAGVDELEEVAVKLSIVGLGETRQVQSMDAFEAERYPAGTSLLKLLDRLPGVHFTNSDAQGSYGWAKRISIRGFTQQQLGFTLDRVPLGDQSYGNHNGLHVGRAVIAENLGVLELSQGGGTLDTASTSNLGGTLRVITAEPEYDFALRLDQTLGSDNASRTFARIDTGDRHGWRTFVSALHQTSEKWKGWGPQRQNQLNFKTTREFGTAVFTAFFNASRRMETDYADLSLVSTATRGWDWDNYAPDYDRAIAVAQSVCDYFVAPYPYENECEDAYYLGRGLRDDDLGYLTLDWAINDRFSLITTVYSHKNEGQGHWIIPYADPNARTSPEFPLSRRASEYYIDRQGLMPTLTGFLGAHKIEAGLWLEQLDHDFYRNWYPLWADTPPDRGAFVDSPIWRDFAASFEVETLTYFIQDRVSLMDGRLTLDFGFKGVDVDYDSRRLYDSKEDLGPHRTRFANGAISAKDSFIPKAAVRYGFTDKMEGFLSYGENISVFRAGVAGLFNTDQCSFDWIVSGTVGEDCDADRLPPSTGNLEPETSRTIEGGVRLVTERFEGSAIVYDVLFENRLLAIQPCPSIQGCASIVVNVGSVETRGLELAGLWRVADGIEWYNSVAYNRSKYADDYFDGRFSFPDLPPGVIPASGKYVVDSPELLVSSNLSWTFGNWDLRLGAKYTDERYFTFVNDGKVDAYTVVNVGLVYRLNELSWAEYGKIQFNITNLFDDKHHATIGTNGFFTRYNPDGYMHTLQQGAPRQFYVTASFNF